ncbi:MAG TPA: 4Fe-4S dicluster domain-containing protein [Phycisphaerae bacterium]|jgi:electron transport complex protein RnfC|nr:4Fe-4S dicluster domain-containing protein [Phycisphaerae bacterium]HOB76615.1 4Fe-4S dicluster domain-containing protein [Phycisphaerae bacterium]HOJ56079.1 4Fe-4S dicluster domain-containing protein [Phycisphaerae bacterium]HOL28382.1 4Fe-4S dicluster domain-containing protein [Phycisphaerae bacterium]HPP22853.1 4Fe-4S dicluster domain-containing protein [Phycisphaerae bacterium]
MRIPRLIWRHFEGGAYLPMEAGTLDGPVHELPAPRRLVVPLAQHEGRPARPLVEPGQTLEAGTLIGRTDGDHGPGIHAPLAGRVTAITRVDTALATDVLAIEIAVSEYCSQHTSSLPDQAGKMPTPQQSRPALSGGRASSPPYGSKRETPGLERAESPPPPTCSTSGLHDANRKDGPVKRNPTELANAADHAGVIDLARPFTPLGEMIREAASSRPDHLIINGLRAEPMVTANLRVLRDHLEEILNAGMVLQAALGIKRIWLAVDRTARRFVRQCRSAVAGTPVRILALANKYPQAIPTLLAWTVTGRETPPGRSPLQAGVMVLDAVALADFWRALQHGSPVISRVVTVDGPAVLRPGHYRIMVGTTYGEVVERAGLKAPLVRLIDGGPLTGRCVESLEAVVTKATTTILLIDHDGDRIPTPGPCIRCGECQQVCPVGLDPRKLLDASERNRPQDVVRLHPHACVECGLCSYLCPAELPLAEAAVKLKHYSARS